MVKFVVGSRCGYAVCRGPLESFHYVNIFTVLKALLPKSSRCFNALHWDTVPPYYSGFPWLSSGPSAISASWCYHELDLQGVFPAQRGIMGNVIKPEEELPLLKNSHGAGGENTTASFPFGSFFVKAGHSYSDKIDLLRVNVTMSLSVRKVKYPWRRVCWVEEGEDLIPSFCRNTYIHNCL